MLNQQMRDPWDHCAAKSNAEICDSHRLAARFVKAPREQYLIRQRTAANISQSIKKIKKVEHAQAGDAAQADQRDSRYDDASHHEAARTEAVHHPSGDKPERRTNHQFAYRVA